MNGEDVDKRTCFFGRIYAGLALAILLVFGLSACSDDTISRDNKTESLQSIKSDEVLAQLYESQQSDVQVGGKGVVSRLLVDDEEGSRHQRFVLELDSGQSLLVAHNIVVAPRLDGLQVGDTVEFYGEYFYNEQGGGIHWTHRDSSGIHEDGWLLYNGNFYA